MGIGLVISDGERAELVRLSRLSGGDARVAFRARIVLGLSQGKSAAEVAAMVGTTDPTVRLWRRRYVESGVAGLAGVPRPGKGPVHDGRVRARIVAVTRTSPPQELGLSHWSSRTLAAHLRRAEGTEVSHEFVATVWREAGLRPGRQGTFKLSKDPRFADKVTDIVGLYLSPPEGAVVLCVDEKSQIQALDRTQPLLPMTFDKNEKRTHDYIRHGTTTLFGAYDTATGRVHGQCHPAHRATEFITFMDSVVAQYPGREMHVILDNFATHSTAAVSEWLQAHPNVTFHKTPVSGSWLNQIETWFGLLTRQAIRRGTFVSVPDLQRTIDNYIASWIETAKPFTWTATADAILGKVKFIEGQVKKLTGH